jgi:hypothetical protein
MKHTKSAKQRNKMPLTAKIEASYFVLRLHQVHAQAPGRATARQNRSTPPDLIFVSAMPAVASSAGPTTRLRPLALA